MFKKMMMLAVMLALVLAVAVPAIAQGRHHQSNGSHLSNGNGGVSQELGNETESGDVSANFSVTSSGDNSNQCVTPLQFGNTGNLQNAQGFLQYASNADDLQAEGPTFEFKPELTAPCEQTVQQSSAASSG